MRPGQLTPTEFERAILNRIAQEVPVLGAGLTTLHVLSREFTGVGSFTHFSPNSTPANVPDGPITLSGLIDVPGVHNGMGAALFIKNGHADVLETFTFGSEYWDGTYNGFSLRDA